MGTQLFEGVGRGSTFHFDPKDVYLITDPKHKLYDERVTLPLDEEFIAQLMEIGVKTPIIVVRHSDLPDDLKIDRLDEKVAVCIDGHQRVLHLREANKRILKKGGVPYKVKAVNAAEDELEKLWGIKVALNYHRPESMLERGKKAQILMKTCGYSLEDTAKHFAVTTKAVEMWLALGHATPEVIRAMQEGVETEAGQTRIHLSESAAARLCELPKKEQPAALKQLYSSGNPTVANAVKVVKAAKEEKEPPRGKSEKRTNEDVALDRKGLSKSLLRKIHKAMEGKPTPMPVSYGFLKGIAFVLGEDDHRGLDDSGVIDIIEEIAGSKIRSKETA